MWKPYEYKGTLDALLTAIPGDEPWRRIRTAGDMDDLKRWLFANNVRVCDALQAVREAIQREIDGGTNHPDLLLETRSLAKKYGFDEPGAFFAAVYDQ